MKHTASDKRMNQDTESLYVFLHSRIEREVMQLKQKHGAAGFGEDATDDELLLTYNQLLRYARDIDSIRVKVYESKQLNAFNKKLHVTDRDIQNLLLDAEMRIDAMYRKAQAQKELERKHVANAANGGDISDDVETIGRYQHDEFEGRESIESLKSRLLSTRHDQLDQVESTELQNNYHDSIQQELIDSLPSMVSSLKDQALQFQEMIKQDAVILKEATQNFETSHGRFDNVNTLLSKYHKEGRLGFWFYIRIISMVLVSFLFLLIIIRLIPARH